MSEPLNLDELEALAAEGAAMDRGPCLPMVQRLSAAVPALVARVRELEADIRAVAGGALVEEAEQGTRRIYAEVERDMARQALTSADAMERHWDEINAERDDLRARLEAAERERDEWFNKACHNAADFAALRDAITQLADEWESKARMARDQANAMSSDRRAPYLLYSEKYLRRAKEVRALINPEKAAADV